MSLFLFCGLVGWFEMNEKKLCEDELAVCDDFLYVICHALVLVICQHINADIRLRIYLIFRA